MKKLILLVLILSTIIFCSQIAYAYIPKNQKIWIESVEHIWSKNGDCEIVVTVGHRDSLKNGGGERALKAGKIKEWVVFAYYGKVPGKTYYNWIPSSASGRQVSFKVPQAHLQMNWVVKMPYADKYHNEVKRDYELSLFLAWDDPLKKETYHILRGGEMGCECGITGDFLDLLNEEWKTEEWTDGDVRRRSRFVDCTKEDIKQLFDSTRPLEPASQEYVNFVQTNPPVITLKGSSYSGDWAAGTFVQTFELGYTAACNPSLVKSREFDVKITYGVRLLPFAGRMDVHDVIGIKKIKITITGDSKTITLKVPQAELNKSTQRGNASNPILITGFKFEINETIPGRDSRFTEHFIEVDSTITVN
jgi:hypothetical protein